MSRADEDYIDADAPVSEEELAAAAVVLAAGSTNTLDPTLEKRLEADARAYFDARRKPRAVTTTSGTEVVITEREEEASLRSRSRSRFGTIGWIAAAACVGLAVFVARSRPATTTTTTVTATADAPAVEQGNLRVRVDGGVEITGLSRCPPGSRYVLSAVGGDGGPAVKLAVFSETPFRYEEGVKSATELTVTPERDAAEPSTVARWRRSGL